MTSSAIIQDRLQGVACTDGIWKDENQYATIITNFFFVVCQDFSSDFVKVLALAFEVCWGRADHRNVLFSVLCGTWGLAPSLIVFILPLGYSFFFLTRFAPAMANPGKITRPSADMETQFSTCWQNCTPLPTVQKTFGKCSWSVFTTIALTWKATPMETATLRSAELFFKRCARTWPTARLRTKVQEMVQTG